MLSARDNAAHGTTRRSGLTTSRKSAQACRCPHLHAGDGSVGDWAASAVKIHTMLLNARLRETYFIVAKMAAQALDKEKLSNLSFILNKPLDVAYVEQPKPTIEDPHNVLVAVNYTGICGSDVHYYVHGAIGHFVVREPMVLGHESSGTVVEVGSAVTDLKPGDRVALEPGYGCRRCKHCRAGKYNLCAKMIFAATPPHHGTLTGVWAAPSDFCYKLPDQVSLQEGALIEPLAVAVHIVRQGDVRPGSSVVVMGAGPVGLLCAAVARAHGASKVVSVDIVQSKLDFARSFCSTHTYASQKISAEDNAAALKEAAGLGDGADVVIDASGAEPSIQASIHTVRMGGTYVQGGMGKADITFPIMAMCLKEVTVRGSFRYGPGDYELAIELVASGKVDVKKLVSEVVEFRQAEEAFKKVREGQVIKILIGGPNQ
ncbi:xylitol dehydrogenase [Beauveria bassiana ARSEF 2860]|uniref:L-arabinitol 4-dehydrogenase n=1 Tax=Beauveria bassiana (strain ARSEF 2860) TaxID=655819 RepID=J4UN57_BEAB2|nr:xylitol dehydrogenase [Beauveria bassiana ARSEF 2860]EJP66442.1 xylitol dehydrogenase [Beauveria bassiana ARSEF 2860]